jgi:hypothetical protein
MDKRQWTKDKGQETMDNGQWTKDKGQVCSISGAVNHPQW